MLSNVMVSTTAADLATKVDIEISETTETQSEVVSAASTDAASTGQAALESVLANQAGDSSKSNSNSNSHSHLQSLSQMSMEAILALQFAEPLPQVVARAKKAAKITHVSEAMQAAGHKMPPNVQALLQSSTALTASLRSSTNAHHKGQMVGYRGLGATAFDDSTFGKAMAFINGEYMTVREKLDLKLLECGFFKLVKEKLLYETQDKLDELAMDMGLAEATMESCQGEIQKQQDVIYKLGVELDELTRQCKITHDELAAAKALVEEDLRVINLILNVTREECIKMGVKVSAASASLLTVHACLGQDGKTYFEAGSSFIQDQASKLKMVSSQQAFQRALFELYGLDSSLPGKVNLKLLDEFDDEDTDDFPEELEESFIQAGDELQLVQAPEAGTSNTPKNNDMRERCTGVAAKPNCRKILDKLSQMKGEILDRLQIATETLQKWDKKCEIEINDINVEIAQSREIISMQTVELQKATAFHNGLAIEHGHQLVIKSDLCEDLREKYTECYKELKEFEREMCGLLVIRQAVYNRVKNPDKKKPEMIIQDCVMSDWVVGECSSTCLDANGRPGIQIISRSETGTSWDPNCTDKSGVKAPEDKCPGRYGASCPPDAVDRDCATVHCPIDCEMGDWSGWSECTAPCGGGSHERHRGIDRPADHGGKMCLSLADSGECNMDSCDQDCVLSDWSAWGPCSKSCLGKSTWLPGKQSRTKTIKEPTVGAGFCPEPRTEMRYEMQACNNFICPKNIECVADLDVVIIQDGSGSLWYRWGGKSQWDRNFELSKKFILTLIEESRMAKVDAEGRPSGGLRYGVVLYSFNPRVISQISHDKKELDTKVKGMKWPMGGTMTGRALLKAKQLFPLATGSGKRMQVIILVTDGRASNRVWAYQAAKAVRDSGIRLIVVPVKGALRNKGDMCAWASKPCEENMILTPKWTMLISKLKLYLTTMCPTVEVPGATGVTKR
jgi:hypothetical protein